MILDCLKTSYVQEVFLHVVSNVQNKANPDKPPQESAVSQIQQAKLLHEMFVNDLQIEHRLTLLAETAAQIVNNEPFQVAGQCAPPPPTPEHGQNQQVTESDLTVSGGRLFGGVREVYDSDNAKLEHKQMYETLVKNMSEAVFKDKGDQDVLLKVNSAIPSDPNHKD